MRSTRARPARPLAGMLAIAAGCALVASGCGEEERTTSAAAAAEPGSGGVLAWAMAGRVEEIDPLRASTRSEQVVTRQVHEPLVETLVGPFGDAGRMPGLALSVAGTAGDTIWRLRLRTGVRFQDGTPFNAAAVLANGERWRTTPEGQALMPGLFALDAPRPDLVRFFLDRPDTGFAERLAAPQAGIVSPAALSPRSGAGAVMRRETRTGSGPFELRETESGGALVARNLSWWGSDRELGPAFDQVDFRAIADPAERLALLGAGDVEVADELGPGEVREAARDPLLDVLEGGGTALGLERSVRGITSAVAPPSLSGVWLTTVGEG
jgi:peptide/nickel transport system substrate-binding protein